MQASAAGAWPGRTPGPVTAGRSPPTSARATSSTARSPSSRRGGLRDSFEASVGIDRPIEQVFDFLVDGENDKKFSSRVQEIKKVTDGPIGPGTVYASTVKDAGIKTHRELELDVVQRPTRIRWRELSKGPATVPRG